LPHVPYRRTCSAAFYPDSKLHFFTRDMRGFRELRAPPTPARQPLVL
jgi:hypothetical protein